MNVSWERYSCGDFHYKCSSWPYECNKCTSHGRYKAGQIRLNLSIRGEPLTIMVTLFHEFLHFLIDKSHAPKLLHKILDNIDKERRGE